MTPFSMSKSTAFGGAIDEGHIVGPREAASNQILGGQDEVKKIIDLPGLFNSSQQLPRRCFGPIKDP